MPTSTDPVIAVLGSTVEDGAPSPALRRRLDTVANEWLVAHRSGLRPLVICLGGIGGKGIQPEAPVMANYLESHGIPRAVLVEEAWSRTTEENLLHLRAILTHDGFPEAWAGLPATDVPDPRTLDQRTLRPGKHVPLTIVTSRSHLPRTKLLAKGLGLAVRGIPAPEPVAPLSLLREAGALILWGARTVGRKVTNY